MPIKTPETPETPDNLEVPASTAANEGDSSNDALVRHPTWKDQVLSIPFEKVREYEEAGWELVKDDEDEGLRNKAVPSGRAYRHHFGLSSTP